MQQICGVVYTMNNDANDNQVFAFARNQDGELTKIKAFSTGGRGTGAQKVDPLASQGSLLLSQDKRFLFVVNAGSNSITSFAVARNGGLSLLDIIPSNGEMPNTLAVWKDVLYVANAGNPDMQIASNISLFQIDCCGRLSPLSHTSYPLSTPNAQPSCIALSPDGDQLIVSELSTNQLSVFMIKRDGTLSSPVVNASNGAGPFGSAFHKSGLFLVTEAGVNALSSYQSISRGQLRVISGSVANSQKATCWVSLNREQAYTSNAGTDTISIYDIASNGTLTLRKNVLSNPNGSAAPLDNGVSCDGRYFYVLNGNEGSISAFRISYNGNLIFLQVYSNTGLPTLGAQGLAVL